MAQHVTHTVTRPQQATYTLTSPPTPGLDPPPGVIPNFHQPYTLLPYTELTIASCAIITTGLVAARIYVKAHLVKKYLWEDYTCILGWLAYMVFVILEWRSATRGAGTHQWDLAYADVQYYWRMSNVADMFVCVAYGCIKVSILLLITRIFLAVKRNVLFLLTQALMWANGLYYAVAFFINIFACRPRKKIWNPEMPGNCFDVTSLYISSAVFNTFSDVAMLAVPIIMVWKLQMSTKRKLGISAIFGTGGFATICAVTRIYFQMKLIHSKDFTFVHMQTGLLGLVTAFSLLRNGNIGLGPVGKNGHKQTNRSLHESYNPDNTVKGGNWVKLEDGTMTPMPKVHGVERAPSDERALNDAIIGISGKV